MLVRTTQLLTAAAARQGSASSLRGGNQQEGLAFTG